MNKTILIIDDDDMLRSALMRGLGAEGFSTLGAASAESATKILARVRVDAIVLDRMMAGTDGLTFLQELRGQGNTTPVIMLTAMTGPENAIAGLDSGANDYLAKPFQLRELILRMNNIIRRHDADTTPLPEGLIYTDDEFFIKKSDGGAQLLGLSGEEKKLLLLLTSPIGNIAAAAPMVAKRLRGKLNGVLSNIDIVTIRGRGYKLVNLANEHNKQHSEEI